MPCKPEEMYRIVEMMRPYTFETTGDQLKFGVNIHEEGGKTFKEIEGSFPQYDFEYEVSWVKPLCGNWCCLKCCGRECRMRPFHSIIIRHKDASRVLQKQAS
eukprot:FR735021.1.p1 GENE.FR735021.1~~FR735021.1.p1  ORF type:complete len:112 (+),score=2.26 FR735021.1:32-337(+)